MPKVLKFWHQWSWAIHCCVWLVMGTGLIITFKDGVANNTKDISTLQQQHTDEHMETRMVRQEQVTQDIGNRLERIETVQEKIFDRINTIADRGQRGR